jgi:hypothetical protein
MAQPSFILARRFNDIHIRRTIALRGEEVNDAGWRTVAALVAQFYGGFAEIAPKNL